MAKHTAHSSIRYGMRIKLLLKRKTRNTRPTCTCCMQIKLAKCKKKAQHNTNTIQHTHTHARNTIQRRWRHMEQESEADQPTCQCHRHFCRLNTITSIVCMIDRCVCEQWPRSVSWFVSVYCDHVDDGVVCVHFSYGVLTVRARSLACNCLCAMWSNVRPKTINYYWMGLLIAGKTVHISLLLLLILAQSIVARARTSYKSTTLCNAHYNCVSVCVSARTTSRRAIHVMIAMTGDSASNTDYGLWRPTTNEIERVRQRER